jgi:hypothetical protein
VKVGFLHCWTAKAEALLGRTGSVGLEFAVGHVKPLVERFSAKIDLILVAMVAEEERLASVRDEDEGVVG